MDPTTLLPIRPTSPTLSSHLSALDKTISQLDNLPSQTKWPAYIPLTSRARIQGQIIHPNEVKVDLGDGWWVEMTALEAGGYLKRRKIALLEAQAKLLEGVKGSGESKKEGMGLSEQLPPAISLNSLFMGIDSATTSSSSSKPKATSSSSATPITTNPSRSVIPQSAATISSPIQAATTINETDSLQAILEKFVSNEKSLMEASQGSDKEVLTNEEGLPIRDICETPDGELIGPALESELADEDLQSTVDMDRFDKEAYDDPAAVERRRAAWERVFGKDDDDEDESEDEEESKVEEDKEQMRSVSPIETDTEIPTQISSRPPTTTSTPTSIPRGILKPPPTQTRKKSVSFDHTVPLPPDSPEPDPSATKKMGFDMALNAPSVDQEEFGVRPVPVIAVPVPGKKTQGGFGGMKRGFLDPPSVAGTSKGEVKKDDVGGKKKPSLFAQRMAGSVVKESPVPKASSSVVEKSAIGEPTKTGSGSRIPELPTMANSATSATNTLRSSVIEKPIPTPSPKASSSKLPPTPSSSKSDNQAEEVGFIDDDDDYDSDLSEEEEEEDEYDLDDALLAREVALEYHRRRAYSSPYTSQDPDDPNYGYIPSETSDTGGVMLAIPSIDSTDGTPTIINPTPDDFRRFVRVGKLENGNLVLAPGEEGWSDDEEDEGGELEIERRRKRDNRSKIKEALMGRGDGGEKALSVPRGKGTIGNLVPGVKESKETVVEEGLPPVVITAPKETVAPAVGAVKERRVDVDQGKEAVVGQPKKVSRFKAARMGGM